MPLKIKKLKVALSRAGFYSRTAKGSHTVWRHPANPAIRVTLSGKDGSDAQQYQIDDVREALRKTLYVKPFWDEFEQKRKIGRKERWRNDFNQA